MEILLWIVIGAAVIFVIGKKIRDFKNGKYCSCNCEGCSMKCKKVRDCEKQSEGKGE